MSEKMLNCVRQISLNKRARCLPPVPLTATNVSFFYFVAPPASNRRVAKASAAFRLVAIGISVLAQKEIVGPCPNPYWTAPRHTSSFECFLIRPPSPRGGPKCPERKLGEGVELTASEQQKHSTLYFSHCNIINFSEHFPLLLSISIL